MSKYIFPAVMILLNLSQMVIMLYRKDCESIVTSGDICGKCFYKIKMVRKLQKSAKALLERLRNE